MPSGVYERRPCMRTYGKTKAIAAEVRYLRWRGKTFKEIAAALGVAQSTVGALETGEWNPSRRRKTA